MQVNQDIAFQFKVYAPSISFYLSSDLYQKFTFRNLLHC